MPDDVAKPPVPCADKPPAVAIVGEPGDSKVFLLQLIAEELGGRRLKRRHVSGGAVCGGGA